MSSSAAAGRWLQTYFAGIRHDFYSAVPESFTCDPMIVGHLNRHFRHNNLNNFKTCFKVLSGVKKIHMLQSDDAPDVLESVRVMHDMVHGRFVISDVGLESVRDKHVSGLFGKCPRLFCEGQFLLPLGMDDVPGVSLTQCFCVKCRDVYSAPTHVAIDSVAFGSSLPHLFLDRFPDMSPSRPQKFYVPRIFGFKIHASSPLYNGDMSALTTASIPSTDKEGDNSG